MSDETIRILITDDHSVVRRGLATLLATEADLEVVGEAGNGREAIAKAAELEPDVILMDLVMPELDGVEASRQILAATPDVKILILTSFGSDDKLFPAIKAGVHGYLLKDASPDELIDAIRQTHRGQSSLNPEVARRLLREMSKEEPAPEKAARLTDREKEVLRQLARGLSNEGLAKTLFISEATARTHVSNILGKLELASRTQAALYALRHGLASLDDVGDFD
jgi:NarL family two-component system response regulator LiaR